MGLMISLSVVQRVSLRCCTHRHPMENLRTREANHGKRMIRQIALVLYSSMMMVMEMRNFMWFPEGMNFRRMIKITATIFTRMTGKEISQMPLHKFRTSTQAVHVLWQVITMVMVLLTYLLVEGLIRNITPCHQKVAF